MRMVGVAIFGHGLLAGALTEAISRRLAKSCRRHGKRRIALVPEGRRRDGLLKKGLRHDVDLMCRGSLTHFYGKHYGEMT